MEPDPHPLTDAQLPPHGAADGPPVGEAPLLQLGEDRAHGGGVQVGGAQEAPHGLVHQIVLRFFVRNLMSKLATLAELAQAPPALRLKGIKALMAFNSLDLETALAHDRTLAAAHPTAPLYTLACKRIMFNLASNPALHGVPPEALVRMSDEEMAKGTVVERVQQQERARHEAYLDMLKEKQAAVGRTPESVLHCRRCSSADLNFVQVQTRSADEPMTCFLTCNACKHRWRMS